MTGSTQVKSTQEIVGTMNGQRGIQFIFTPEDEDPAHRLTVTFDFYGNGEKFNGATYARIESAALNAMVKAGYSIKTFTHYIIY